jgi:hypothetical protein
MSYAKEFNRQRTHGDFGGQHATRAPEQSSHRIVSDDELRSAHLERYRAAMDEQDQAPASRWLVGVLLAVAVIGVVLVLMFSRMTHVHIW